MATPNPVPKLYRSIVEDVINNVRESFLDENVDEQVLQELKQLWESKMLHSKAVDNVSPETDQLGLYTNLQSRPHAVVTQQMPTQIPVQVQGQLPILSASSAPLGMSPAAQTATMALPAGIYHQQLAALQRGTITLQPGQVAPQIILQTGQLLTGVQSGTTTANNVTRTFTIPAGIAPNQPVAHIQPATAAAAAQPVIQLDGANDSSSDDEDNDDDDDDDDKDDDDDQNDVEGEEEDPLNSADDISDEDPTELFDADNVIVCQFDKINRSKNKWKFYLKDGIMNLNGKDYVFQKGNGDAEW